jgi:hypothetical protein
MGTVFRRHFYWVLAAVALGVLIWLLWRWSKRPRGAK